MFVLKIPLLPRTAKCCCEWLVRRPRSYVGRLTSAFETPSFINHIALWTTPMNDLWDNQRLVLLSYNLWIPCVVDLRHNADMFGKAKPYSAVTAQIERLTGEGYEVDDLSGIVDLIEVINLQNSGPTEAARAIRKKLYACTLCDLCGTKADPATSGSMVMYIDNYVL